MIIGIDLGTTNSLVAYYKDGKARIINNRLNHPLTPSVVAIDENNTILVGEVAREYGYTHPASVAKTFKRAMGTDQKFKINEQYFSAVELSSFVLASLKESAEEFLQQEVQDAIISVPAYFNDNQRKATIEAGRLAGLNVVRIINEPTASAISYGVGSSDKMERCLVFDLGGGTFDVSILEYFHSIMEVHAIAGDNQLGGEDFTNALVKLFIDKQGLDMNTLDLYTLNSLYKNAEHAKCSIKMKNQIIDMKASIQGEIKSASFMYHEYVKACEPLLEKLRKPIEKAIRDARITLDEIDRVILVGGASRSPIIHTFVEKTLHISPEYSVDLDQAVALGAALQCGMRSRDTEIQEMILTEVCPFTLGTEVVHETGMFVDDGHYLPIIERNTVIPVSKTQRVYTAHDNQKKVRVPVLQGESRLAKNNFLLGEVTIDVPVGPKGQEAIDITYTYDIDSLLEVEVFVLSTHEKKKIVIQKEEHKLSEEEIEERLQKLQYLKRNPREEEENAFVIYKGERLYEESFSTDREVIEKALIDFSKVLEKGDRLEIERARKRTLALFEEIEGKDVLPVFS